jgi:hypothetical protein
VPGAAIGECAAWHAACVAGGDRDRAAAVRRGARAMTVGDEEGAGAMSSEMTGETIGEPIFSTAPIETVFEGMTVVDLAGERLGTVAYVQMGDPEAVTTQGAEQPAADLVTNVARSIFGGEPDVPEPLRSQLQRTGYIKIDGSDLTDADRYVRADLIGGVSGDTVMLTAERADLVAEA